MKNYFVAFGDFGGSDTPPFGGSAGFPFGGVATPPFWPPAPAAGEAAPAFWTFTMSDFSPLTGAGTTEDAATRLVPKTKKRLAVACFRSMSCPFFWFAHVGQDNVASWRSHGKNLICNTLKATVIQWAPATHRSKETHS
jgi:hypothetical protein